MATHSSTLAWRIPWTEEPGRLQSMGSLGVGHDWATSLSLFTFIPWRRKWQPKILEGFSDGSDGKESACNAGDLGSIPGWGRFPGVGNDYLPSILAWRIPWTEEPGGLHSMGSQWVRHDWMTNVFTFKTLEQLQNQSRMTQTHLV